MIAKGKVHKFGDNVDTDVIIPARYLNKSDEAWLASHCMEDIDKDFVNKVQPGDIMVAKANFGCGSSREHAPIAIKASGISCVIASTFARIFYRNAINIGLAILECDQAANEINQGDEVQVDFDSGVITDLTTGKVYQAQPFPPFIQNIIKNGGWNYEIAPGQTVNFGYTLLGDDPTAPEVPVQIHPHRLRQDAPPLMPLRELSNLRSALWPY